MDSPKLKETVVIPIKKLEKIKKLLSKAYDVLYSMTEEQQEAIRNFHNENWTLQYCLRRWEQAVEDILND